MNRVTQASNGRETITEICRQRVRNGAKPARRIKVVPELCAGSVRSVSHRLDARAGSEVSAVRGGRRRCQLVADSYALASASILPSEKWGPEIHNPMGSRDALNPQGIEIAGVP